MSENNVLQFTDVGFVHGNYVLPSEMSIGVIQYVVSYHCTFNRDLGVPLEETQRVTGVVLDNVEVFSPQGVSHVETDNCKVMMLNATRRDYDGGEFTVRAARIYIGKDRVQANVNQFDEIKTAQFIPICGPDTNTLGGWPYPYTDNGVARTGSFTPLMYMTAGAADGPFVTSTVQEYFVAYLPVGFDTNNPTDQTPTGLMKAICYLPYIRFPSLNIDHVPLSQAVIYDATKQQNNDRLLDREIKSAQSEVTALQAQVHTLDNSLQAAQSSINNVTSIVNNAARDVASLTTDVQGLQTTVAQNSSDITSINVSLGSMQTVDTQHDNKLVRLETEINLLKNQVDSLTQIVTGGGGGTNTGGGNGLSVLLQDRLGIYKPIAFPTNMVRLLSIAPPPPPDANARVVLQDTWRAAAGMGTSSLSRDKTPLKRLRSSRRLTYVHNMLKLIKKAIPSSPDTAMDIKCSMMNN